MNGVDGTVGCDQDHRERAALVGTPSKQLQTADPGHLHVRDHCVEVGLLERCDRLCAIAGRLGLVAIPTKVS